MKEVVKTMVLGEDLNLMVLIVDKEVLPSPSLAFEMLDAAYL